MKNEYEEEFKEKIVACNVTCNMQVKECEVRCSTEKWIEDPYIGKALEGRYEKFIEKFKVKSEGEAIEKTKDVSEKFRVPTTLDIDNNRLLIEGRKVVAGVGNEEFVEKYIENLQKINIKVTQLRRALREKKGEYTIYVDAKEVEKWEREFGDDPERYIPYHPAVKGLMLLFYKYVKPEEVQTTCLPREPEVKGVAFEEYGDKPCLNLAWRNLELASLALGLSSYREVAEQLLHTALHEYIHHIEAVNLREYRGSWTGEGGLETLISVLTGKPAPAGSEAIAQELAELALDKVVKKYFPKIIDKVKERLRREVEEILKDEDTKSTVNYVKKFMKWLEKKFPDEVFFDVAPHREDVAVKTTFMPKSEKSKFEEWLRKNFPKEYEELKRLEREKPTPHEYFELEQELYIKAFEKLFNEFREKFGVNENVEVSEVVEGGWVKVRYPALTIEKTNLTSTCDEYEADVTPPPEL